jgi:hypothetical protein
MRLIRGVAISGDGTLLTACDSDGHITIWDISKDNQYSFPSYIEPCARARARSSCWGGVFGRGPLAKTALIYCEDNRVIPLGLATNNLLAAGSDRRTDSDVNANVVSANEACLLGEGPGLLQAIDASVQFEAMIDDECGWCLVRPLQLDGESCLCELEEPCMAAYKQQGRLWVHVCAVRQRSVLCADNEALEEGANVLVCVPRGDHDVYFDGEVVEFVPGGGLQGFFGQEASCRRKRGDGEPAYRVRFVHGRDEGWLSVSFHVCLFVIVCMIYV